MTARLIESRPPGTPLARQRWECSVCGLDFEPNFEDGAEMTIRRRIEKMKQSFKAHAAWHLEQEGGAPSIGTRVRRLFARQE
jgi:hypothetical protein